MKVKIKKEGKVKEFKLIDSWSDVNLQTWLDLAKLEGVGKSEEAAETIAALSDMPQKLIKELSIQDVAVIMSKISELQEGQDSSLKKVIEIEGKRYGFHPDLDEITLGEYADLEQFIKIGVEKHLPEIVAILYRPIVEENNGVYTIAAYDGDISIRAEEMKKMSAEQVQSALVFFYHLGSVLLMTSQSYLIGRLKEMRMQ